MCGHSGNISKQRCSHNSDGWIVSTKHTLSDTNHIALCPTLIHNPPPCQHCANWAQADLKSEPRQAEDGRLWTPGAVDFFRTVNEQLSVVEEYTAGGLLLRTAQAAITAMKEFQVRLHSDGWILGVSKRPSFRAYNL